MRQSQKIHIWNEIDNICLFSIKFFKMIILISLLLLLRNESLIWIIFTQKLSSYLFESNRPIVKKQWKRRSLTYCNYNTKAFFFCLFAFFHFSVLFNLVFLLSITVISFFSSLQLFANLIICLVWSTTYEYKKWTWMIKMNLYWNYIAKINIFVSFAI